MSVPASLVLTHERFEPGRDEINTNNGTTTQQTQLQKNAAVNASTSSNPSSNSNVLGYSQQCSNVTGAFETNKKNVQRVAVTIPANYVHVASDGFQQQQQAFDMTQQQLFTTGTVSMPLMTSPSQTTVAAQTKVMMNHVQLPPVPQSVHCKLYLPQPGVPEDSFICGPCDLKFNRLDHFLQHKQQGCPMLRASNQQEVVLGPPVSEQEQVPVQIPTTSNVTIVSQQGAAQVEVVTIPQHGELPANDDTVFVSTKVVDNQQPKDMVQVEPIDDIEHLLEGSETAKSLLSPKPTTPRIAPVKRYSCEFADCTYMTAYSKDLDRHWRIHTGARPYPCSHCEKSFSRLDHLKIHNYDHTGGKPYQCQNCNYSTAEKSALKKHIRIHTGERPYKCQICPYASRNSSQLVVHLRSHTGDAPFQCHICPSKFTINSDLKRHMRTHTGEKPYKCEMCDYRCAVKGNMQIHHKINHSSDNQFKCDHEDCGFQSSSQRALREHRKTHNPSLQTFECRVCHYVCISKASLKSHMGTHSDDRPFKCDYCTHSCRQLGNMKAHILRRHPELLPDKKRKNDAKVPIKKKSLRKSGPAGKTTFDCHLCGDGFVREDSYKSHMKQHKQLAIVMESTALAVLQLQTPVTSVRPPGTGSDDSNSRVIPQSSQDQPVLVQEERSHPSRLPGSADQGTYTVTLPSNGYVISDGTVQTTQSDGVTVVDNVPMCGSATQSLIAMSDTNPATTVVEQIGQIQSVYSNVSTSLDNESNISQKGAAASPKHQGHIKDQAWSVAKSFQPEKSISIVKHFEFKSSGVLNSRGMPVISRPNKGPNSSVTITHTPLRKTKSKKTQRSPGHGGRSHILISHRPVAQIPGPIPNTAGDITQGCVGTTVISLAQGQGQDVDMGSDLVLADVEYGMSPQPVAQNFVQAQAPPGVNQRNNSRLELNQQVIMQSNQQVVVQSAAPVPVQVSPVVMPGQTQMVMQVAPGADAGITYKLVPQVAAADGSITYSLVPQSYEPRQNQVVVQTAVTNMTGPASHVVTSIPSNDAQTIVQGSGVVIEPPEDRSQEHRSQSESRAQVQTN